MLELEGDGAPIVMFHGYADSADTWRLCSRRSAGVAGGRSRSTSRVSAPPTRSRRPVLPQLDAFAGAAVEYLGGRRRKVIAVGNSLGGCVSLRLAERCGNLLDGVVAVAPAGLEMSRLLSLVERDPLLRSFLALPAPVPRMVIRAAVARLYRELAFAAPSAIDPAVVAAFYRITATGRRSRALPGDRAPAGPRAARPFQLDRITNRVLLVWGDRDRLVFHRGANRILDVVPGARLELLRGIGHCPQFEVPERFDRAAARFQRRAPGRRAEAAPRRRGLTARALPGELPVKPERDVVRGPPPAPARRAIRVQHEQERALGPAVEHDRQQHAVVLVVGSGPRHEHRLAWEASVLRPHGRAPLDDVALDDLVEPACAGADAAHIPVRMLVAAHVVDPRKLECVVQQRLDRDLAGTRRNPEALEPAPDEQACPRGGRSRYRSSTRPGSGYVHTSTTTSSPSS